MLGDRVMCVQLHGDAAFTGQGVIMEGLGLSKHHVSVISPWLSSVFRQSTPLYQWWERSPSSKVRVYLNEKVCVAHKLLQQQVGVSFC